MAPNNLPSTTAWNYDGMIDPMEADDMTAMICSTNWLIFYHLRLPSIFTARL